MSPREVLVDHVLVGLGRRAVRREFSEQSITFCPGLRALGMHEESVISSELVSEPVLYGVTAIHEAMDDVVTGA